VFSYAVNSNMFTGLNGKVMKYDGEARADTNLARMRPRGDRRLACGDGPHPR